MKDTIDTLKFAVLNNGYTCISVDAHDCPASDNKQRYTDRNKDGKLVWSCHCYDDDKILKPVVGIDENKCEYFEKCINGKVYCKLK